MKKYHIFLFSFIILSIIVIVLSLRIAKDDLAEVPQQLEAAKAVESQLETFSSWGEDFYTEEHTDHQQSYEATHTHPEHENHFDDLDVDDIDASAVFSSTDSDLSESGGPRRSNEDDQFSGRKKNKYPPIEKLKEMKTKGIMIF